MQTNLINQTMLQKKQTIDVIRQRCVQSFWKTFLTGKWHHLCRKSTRLLDLNHFWVTKQISTRHHLGLKTIPINQIVGSEGRCEDFDTNFLPQQSHNRDRWVNIAMAVEMGKTLPPVSLVKIGSSYFVRDGHHRISVFHTLGQLEIDAEIVEWHID